MLEWLILLAGSLLLIINLSAREHATNPPPKGGGDTTIILPKNLQDQLANYKKLLTASGANPEDKAAAQAANAVKTQIELKLAQAQEDTAAIQKRIQAGIDEDAGLGSDVATLHKQITTYEKTLPTLKDTLTKSQVIAADKAQDTSIMMAKAVAVAVLGMFAVFVQGLF